HETGVRPLDPRRVATDRPHVRRTRRRASSAHPADVRTRRAAQRRADRRRVDAVALCGIASSAGTARGGGAQERKGRQGSAVLAGRCCGADRAGGGAGLSGVPQLADRESNMAEHSQFQLLREKRFAPFFWTQFLGAGNDNVYKNALVIFVAFQAATLTAFSSNDLVNIAAAVFIAPFMIFSATAGQLADKFEKSRLIRWVKLFEIAIMVVGLIGFWRRDLAILFTGLALMGVHSTLFGPVKYAILPQHLKPEELIGGNGLVEMGTFVAILLGTIIGGLVVAIEGT